MTDATLTQNLADIAKLERAIWLDPTGLDADDLQRRPMHLSVADTCEAALKALASLREQLEEALHYPHLCHPAGTLDSGAGGICEHCGRTLLTQPAYEDALSRAESALAEAQREIEVMGRTALDLGDQEIAARGRAESAERELAALKAQGACETCKYDRYCLVNGEKVCGIHLHSREVVGNRCGRWTPVAPTPEGQDVVCGACGGVNEHRHDCIRVEAAPGAKGGQDPSAETGVKP